MSKYLAPARKGVFPFLALPAEIRNEIYEYALSFPVLKTQASQSGKDHVSRFFVMRPSLLHHARYVPCDYRSTVHTSSLNEILAITHVSKQTYREALPIFFSCNAFECNSARALDQFGRMLHRSNPQLDSSRLSLCAFEPHRTQYITSITFKYGPDIKMDSEQQDQQLSRIFEELCNAKALRKTAVKFDEDGWWEVYDEATYSGRGIFPIYSEPSELPGVDQLVQLLRQTESYEIHNHANSAEDRIREYLEAEARKV